MPLLSPFLLELQDSCVADLVLPWPEEGLCSLPAGEVFKTRLTQSSSVVEPFGPATFKKCTIYKMHLPLFSHILPTTALDSVNSILYIKKQAPGGFISCTWA